MKSLVLKVSFVVLIASSNFSFAENPLSKKVNCCKDENSMETKSILKLIDSSIEKDITEYDSSLKIVNQDKSNNPIFLECLNLSDVPRISEYLQEDSLKLQIGKVKRIQYIPYYSSSDYSIEIYPDNGTHEKKDVHTCGYFYIEGELHSLRIGQINNNLSKITDLYWSDTYVMPNILGDTAVFLKDWKSADILVEKFCKAVKSGDRALAESYVNFPIAFNDSLYNNMDLFWSTQYYEKCKNIIDVIFKDISEYTYFVPLRVEEYNRGGIFTYQPQNMYVSDDDTETYTYMTDYDCGQIFMHYYESNEGEYKGFPETYAMRIMKVNGELKICSFIYNWY